MDKNKKIILVPGRLNGGGMYTGRDIYSVAEIWKNRISPKKDLEADWMISHSLGCNWALFNWKKHKNSKQILVNPLLPKRGIRTWINKWKDFRKNEIVPENKEKIYGIMNRIFGERITIKLLRYNFDKILNEIPRDDIFIICGENDRFYCDKIFKDYVKSKGITMIEAKGTGHDWHPEIDKEIKKIIESE